MRLYISYHPDDKGFVGRLRLYIQEHLPALEVKQSNPQTTAATIDSIIRDMDVVLVVIGKNWLRTVKQSATILNAPGDYVNRELTAALKNTHIRIAPLLIDEARMPGKQDIPPSLTAFATIHAATIRNTSFEKDVMQVVEMLRSPGDESAWLPSVEYGTIQIRTKKGGFISHYLETEYPPAIILIDNETVGTLQLINKTFEHKVIPGEHIVAIKPGNKVGKQCECRIKVRSQQVSVLYADRNAHWGTLSLRSEN
ncbi:MAG: toll/interleukin-1 receptor domain-containing protein [Chitinophagales bacterium]|nr:toll/interleukin-1 receptor domain-containing protein [Chitinophagales bacterium]